MSNLAGGDWAVEMTVVGGALFGDGHGRLSGVGVTHWNHVGLRRVVPRADGLVISTFALQLAPLTFRQSVFWRIPVSHTWFPLGFDRRSSNSSPAFLDTKADDVGPRRAEPVPEHSFPVKASFILKSCYANAAYYRK